MNGCNSHASGYKFKIDEVNISPVWNLNETDNKLQGGFNFTNEYNILRWMIRGDTLYDVTIPDDAEIISVENNNTPNGVWRTNKIIVSNPKIITDDMCVEFYKISNMPEKTYFHILAIIAGKGFRNVCNMIIRDKIREDNVQLCISEYLEFFFYKGNGIYDEILERLNSLNGGDN